MSMMLFSRAKRDGCMTGDPGMPDAGQSSDQPCGSDATDELGVQLQVLGLARGASWDDICVAHRRLVADLTPGPDASHRNVALARRLLSEVNSAFDSLRARSSVA
jgi:hypothetical protein